MAFNQQHLINSLWRVDFIIIIKFKDLRRSNCDQNLVLFFLIIGKNYFFACINMRYGKNKNCNLGKYWQSIFEEVPNEIYLKRLFVNFSTFPCFWKDLSLSQDLVLDQLVVSEFCSSKSTKTQLLIKETSSDIHLTHYLYVIRRNCQTPSYNLLTWALVTFTSFDKGDGKW